MDRSIAVHQVDVFTRVPLTGNPAAVVPQADGLTDAEMAGIAREMNLSETAFVFGEERPGLVPVRFFTPTQEVPVCGHGTLAAHYVRARQRGQDEGTVVQASPGVRWEVRWERRNGATSVYMRQGPVRYGDLLEEELRRRLSSALGIEESALGIRTSELGAGAPIQVISTGHSKIVVPVESPETLAAIDPDLAELRSLSEETGVGSYFLFALDAAERDTLTVCRMFGPAIGVDEDPVNGSGHGPLAAYLLAHGGKLAAAARDGFRSRMGDHLGRPGQVRVQASEDGTNVEVGGVVTPVFEGELTLPGADVTGTELDLRGPER